MTLRLATEPAAEVAPGILVRYGLPLLHLPEPALDLLNDVELVPDVFSTRRRAACFGVAAGIAAGVRFVYDTAVARLRCRTTGASAAKGGTARGRGNVDTEVGTRQGGGALRPL